MRFGKGAIKGSKGLAVGLQSLVCLIRILSGPHDCLNTVSPRMS